MARVSSLHIICLQHLVLNICWVGGIGALRQMMHCIKFQLWVDSEQILLNTMCKIGMSMVFRMARMGINQIPEFLCDDERPCYFDDLRRRRLANGTSSFRAK